MLKNGHAQPVNLRRRKTRGNPGLLGCKKQEKLTAKPSRRRFKSSISSQRSARSGELICVLRALTLLKCAGAKEGSIGRKVSPCVR